MPFFVIFIILPLLELMVFASVGEEIGLINTLLLALITAIIGGALVRHQGMQTIMAMRDAAERGKVPLSELFDGFCLVVAGATLITPGFITDTIGFLLLIPAVRGAVKSYIRDHTNWSVGGGEFYGNAQQNNPNIIEADYEDITDENKSE
ncbi:MAG: FxsA family protein [Alphaproteobacteria bacterium]|nr:FxsA family protein [Alphaproteobacteria bacterium]